MNYRVICKEDRVFVEKQGLPVLGEVFPPKLADDLYWSDYGWLTRVYAEYLDDWVRHDRHAVYVGF